MKIYSIPKRNWQKKSCIKSLFTEIRGCLPANLPHLTIYNRTVNILLHTVTPKPLFRWIPNLARLCLAIQETFSPLRRNKSFDVFEFCHKNHLFIEKSTGAFLCYIWWRNTKLTWRSHVTWVLRFYESFCTLIRMVKNSKNSKVSFSTHFLPFWAPANSSHYQNIALLFPGGHMCQR